MVEPGSIIGGAFSAAPPVEGGLSLIEMIKTGDSALPDLTLAYMNANPQSVFARDEHGATALHWAAIMCNLPVIRAAVALGLPVHARSGDGMEPIHWACTKGWWQAVQELVQHGADINARNAQMATPVVLAAQYGHTELVNVLVKRGADINLLDEHQDSALHWAAYQGMLATVGLLHHLGLSASAPDNFGSTPMHLAVSQGQAHVVEYFLEQAEPSLLALADTQGRTPVAVAASLAGHSRRHAEIRARLSAHQNSNTLMRLLTFGAVGAADGSRRGRSPFWVFLVNAAAAYTTYALLLQPRLLGEAEAPLHGAYALVNAAMCVLFCATVRTPPGFVQMDAAAREAYEEELRVSAEQATGGAGAGARGVQLCHTCHVVRPLRAKHCAVCGRCVLRYDHHCPWVDNCVARNNYLSFYALQCFGLAACSMHVWACVRYLRANSFNLWVGFLAVDFSLSTLFAFSMVAFHAGLIARNLTTNENVNWRKYPHLKYEAANGRVAFFNAFDGGLCRNILWRTGLVHFDDKPVRTPPPPGSAGAACCGRDHGRSHPHAHSHDEERAPMLAGR